MCLSALISIGCALFNGREKNRLLKKDKTSELILGLLYAFASC